MAEPQVLRLELPCFAPDAQGYSIPRDNGDVKCVDISLHELADRY